MSLRLKNDAQNGPKWLAGALENRFTIDFGRVEKCIEKKTAGGQISQNAINLSPRYWVPGGRERVGVNPYPTIILYIILIVFDCFLIIYYLSLL